MNLPQIKSVDVNKFTNAVIQQAQPAMLLARTPKEKLQLILGEYYKQLEDFKSVFGANGPRVLYGR
jgi:hypothetical protein